MKRILFLIAAILFVSTEGKSQLFRINQERPPNAIYALYQPTDHGVGLRYDQHFWIMGAYGSVSYGTWGLYKEIGLEDHVKVTVGALIPLNDWQGIFSDISVGLNRHFVNEFYVDDPFDQYHPEKIISRPWSFELGITMKMKHFALGLRTDILHWEPCIDLGIPIGKAKTTFTTYSKCKL